MELYENIKRIRQKKGISQRELARRISMSGQMISKIEKNETTPSLDTISKIAKALDVKTFNLLNENIEDTETFCNKLTDAYQTACIHARKSIIFESFHGEKDPCDFEQVSLAMHGKISSLDKNELLYILREFEKANSEELIDFCQSIDTSLLNEDIEVIDFIEEKANLGSANTMNTTLLLKKLILKYGIDEELSTAQLKNIEPILKDVIEYLIYKENRRDKK